MDRLVAKNLITLNHRVGGSSPSQRTYARSSLTLTPLQNGISQVIRYQ